MTDQNKVSVRDEINELTALAIHKDKGYDLEACRTDALMRQAMWDPKHSIEAIVAFLEMKYDTQSIPQNNQGSPSTTTNGEV